MIDFKTKKFTYLLAVAFSLLLISPLFAQDFTQGYSSDINLPRGSVVGISNDDTNKVELVNSDESESVLGVVVRNNDTAVTLTDDRTGVFVATTGRFQVLVTDLNGDVEPGDFVSISPIEGIAMKTDDNQKFVVGEALEPTNFGDSANIISQYTVTNPDGSETEVVIGRILVDIDVQPNPNARSTDRAPEFLVNFSETIAGKPVSALRIYAAIAVLMVASAVAGSLLYSAVRSSIISIGRNPLSKRSVLAGLSQVVIISVIIFMSGLFAVYLILKV